MRLTTLCFLLDNQKSKILLAMKKRGFGVGKWNGPGGKVDASLNESVTDAAKRECIEETGLTPTKLEPRGILEFHFEGKDEWSNRCHIFVSNEWTGTLQETEEMKPEWFDTKAIPFDSMWEDDKIWLPQILSGKDVNYKFYFTGEGKMISHELLVK